MVSNSTLAYTVLWCVLAIYAVLSAVDFGAGFYYWLAGLRPDHGRARSLTLSYLSPVWETTNVFLVLFIVGMIGFFPGAVRAYATGLLLPLSLAVIVLTLRGACFAFHHVAPWADRYLAPVFGIAGLLVPGLLVMFLSGSEDGAIRVTASGVVTVSQAMLWLSPLNLALAGVAMAAAAYLSAAFLARYAAQRRDMEAAAYFRIAAARAGLVVAALAVALAVALRIVAPFHFAALSAIWPLQMIAVMAFVAGWLTVTHGGRRRSGLATALVIGQYVFAVLAFGLTRLPFLVYPSIQAEAALTPPAMYTALMLTLAGGTLVILPALALLYTLFVHAGHKPQPALTTQATTITAKDGREERELAHIAG